MLSWVNPKKGVSVGVGVTSIKDSDSDSKELSDYDLSEIKTYFGLFIMSLVSKYQKWKDKEFTESESEERSQDSSSETCGICLEPFQQKKIEDHDPTVSSENGTGSSIEKGLPKLKEMFPDCSVTQCGHLFHSNCLRKWQDHQKVIMKNPNCPYCRTVF